MDKNLTIRVLIWQIGLLSFVMGHISAVIANGRSLGATIDAAESSQDYNGAPACEQASLFANSLLVIASGLFNEDYYVKSVTMNRHIYLTPIRDFVLHGGEDGISPSALFDAQGYLERNPDVAAAKINPLLHFIKYGAYEGRSGGISCDFSAKNISIPTETLLNCSIFKDGRVQKWPAVLDQYIGIYYDLSASLSLSNAKLLDVVSSYQRDLEMSQLKIYKKSAELERSVAFNESLLLRHRESAQNDLNTEN